MPSGLAAKKLGMSPRTLGKITGNLFVLLPDGREDIGLYVKHGNKGLCVPDYVRAQPEERGWAYSNALVQVVEQYKVQTCCHQSLHSCLHVQLHFQCICDGGCNLPERCCVMSQQAETNVLQSLRTGSEAICFEDEPVAIYLSCCGLHGVHVCL